MADAQESASTMEPEATKEKGLFSRFGRRRDSGEVRSETEWVDTLVAHEEAPPEPLPEGSPFAAGDDTPDEPPAFHLPETPASAFDTPEADDMGTEDPSGPDGMEEVHERSWVRKHTQDMDDIHHYVDHILGTELDPARRRRMQALEVGRTVEARTGRGAKSVHVEGINEDLMIAFTFPEDEFRSARVVYETDGGYVIEVRRAVGGRDDSISTEYYTVSRVGEVAHVLDKLRARQIMREAEEAGGTHTHEESHSETRRDAHGETRTETYTRRTTTYHSSSEDDEPPMDAVHPVEPLPAFSGDPEVPGIQEVPDVDAPEDTAPDTAPPPPSPSFADEPSPEAAPGWPPEDESAESTPEEGGKRFGLFRRKDKDDAAEATPDEGEAKKRSLFRRKEKADAPADAPADAEPDAETPKRKGFRFRRKDKGDDAAADEESPFS